MKTIPELVSDAANESYPGTSFSREVIENASGLLEADARKRAVRALRKAVLQFRPAALKTTPKPTAHIPANAPSKP